MKSARITAVLVAVLGAMIVLALATNGVCAADTPDKMISIVAQMSGTGIRAKSFAAKPKGMWRAGNGYCRIDEEPDPERQVHLRIIMSEPDSWLVDLASNQAKHMVDRGPAFNCRMPIFALSEAMLKGKIGELEYGHELDFFRKNGAMEIEGPKLSAFETKYFRLDVDGASLMLVERVDKQAPFEIVLLQGEKVTQIRYLLWDDQAAFKADLFAMPTGVTMEEVPQGNLK